MPAVTRAATSPRNPLLAASERRWRAWRHRLLTCARPWRSARTCLGVPLLFAVSACQVAPPKPVAPPTALAQPQFTAVTFADLPGWNDDRVQDAWPAFRMSCKALVQRARTQATWQGPCAASEEIAESDATAVRLFFERKFTPYRVSQTDGIGEGLITGYYEPLLAGSRVASSAFPAPLYAPPDDLLVVELADLYPELKGKRVRARLDGRRVVPYWTRAEIDAGKARIDGKVLVNVSDPVDAFFLQIQGSGRVQLAEGGVMRVGYADQNGQPFRSVARVLIDRGELTLGEASMQGIREWGRRNPDKLSALLDENPSYVFFREVPPFAPGTLEARIDGPIGAPAARATCDRDRPPGDSIGRTGLSCHDRAAFIDAVAPARHGTGHGGGDPRRDPRGFFLGLRRRGGRARGPHAPARTGVGVVAERCAATFCRRLMPPGDSATRARVNGREEKLLP